MPSQGVDRSRRVAYDVVHAVDVDGAYANLLLPRLLRERQLPARDAAFATELAYGTLRWQGVLDAVVEAAGGRAIASLDPPVRAVLRLGAYQLLHLRTPSHAAVHATVELARATAGPRPVGLVNALLRAVARADWPTWVRRLAPADPVEGIGFRRGCPGWVARALADALDGDLAELDRALAVDRPSTHLVARPGRITREELLTQAGPDGRPGPWSPYAVHLTGGDPARLPAIRSGAAGVQDEGSQLVALALARADVAGGDGGRWLDLCAGPGGKSALLEGLLPAGGLLVSSDRQPHRARLAAAARLSAGQAVVADGTRPAWSAGAFDRVLVDAPCTGLGALRRRPEVRWRRRPDDVAPLADLQVALLTSAVDAARPGGVVAYVTCSPHLAETRDVVTRALAARPQARQLDARPLLSGVAELGTRPDVQLWPHRQGTDGMYVAVLRREP